MKKLRTILPQQKSLTDSHGNIHSGVFEEYFLEYNLINKKRGLFQRLLNNNLLTEWQAIEILEKDIFVILAVFKFGKMNRSLFLVYDINTYELHDFSSVSFFRHKSSIANTLLNKSETKRQTEKTQIIFTNELNDNKLHLYATAPNVNCDVTFTRIAESSVVSIPMTRTHTVYTEKDFLTPKGVITFNDKVYHLTENHVSIHDDHRGYYPLTSGYDWITCMGDIMYQGKTSKFGLNLTYFYKNLDHTKYNENGYWLNGEFVQLPTVTFNRDGNTWYVRDEQGTVNLEFTKRNAYTDKKRIGIKIDYTLAFGSIKGEIKVNGKDSIHIENMFALGEKRMTQICYQKMNENVD